MPKVTKLHFVNNQSEGDSIAQVKALANYFTLSDMNYDFIYCASISETQRAMQEKQITRKPLIVYCWDYYIWSHKQINLSGDWNLYADMLRLASVIFVPSHAQQLRLKELLGLDSFVVKSGYPTYNLPVSDKGFILDPLRYYPDEQSKWAVQAAKILNIPIIHSEHQYSLEDFRELVASCTFMTSTTMEASTGGLTLMEGLNLGKVSLVSDSPYMGARDYLGKTATYFKHDSFEDLLDKMEFMWKNRSNYYGVISQTSYDLMAKQIYEKITHSNI